MIVVITGSVGVGKTTIAQLLAEKLHYRVLPLNERKSEYMIRQIPELQTVEVDHTALLDGVQKEIEREENIIIEGHFSHFLNPQQVDKLIVLNRPLKDLKREYELRKYNEEKVANNLEVESFDTCYHEALEHGFTEEQILRFENTKTPEVLVSQIITKL